jgi:hypothetical protein
MDQPGRAIRARAPLGRPRRRTSRQAAVSGRKLRACEALGHGDGPRPSPSRDAFPVPGTRFGNVRHSEDEQGGCQSRRGDRRLSHTRIIENRLSGGQGKKANRIN